MSRDKQIEEMALDLCLIDRCIHLPRAECNNTTCAHCEAIALYNAGYRKASDVAREILAELKKVMIDEYRYPIIAELKKKYLGEDINVTTKESEEKK